MAQRFAILGSRGFPSTYGGFETFVRRLAPYLVEQGDEVTVYCRNGAPGVETRDGVRCVTTRGFETTAMSTLSFGATGSLHARRHGFDAMLVLNVANGYYLPGLRRAGIPTGVNVDGLEWERAKWNGIGKAVFRRGAALTARHATEIIVDSQEIGRVWAERWQRRSSYIPYGADVITDAGTDRLSALGLDRAGYLLVVARLVPENNVELFLDALDRMTHRLPAVVVGSTRKQNALVERLRARSAAPDFHWLGHVDDQTLLSQLWANCAAYFHGHSVGGTNPALLQALGLGAPTLALDTPFNAEVLRSADALVPADPTIVAGRLDALVTGESLRHRFADTGKRTIIERFQWADVLARYREVLCALASRGTSDHKRAARASGTGRQP